MGVIREWPAGPPPYVDKSRDKDNRHVRVNSARTFCEIDASHIWHGDVRNQAIERSVLENRHRLDTTGRGQYLEPGLGEQPCGEGPQIVVVIHRPG